MSTFFSIFTRIFDFIAWLLPMLLDAAFDLRERLEDANLRRLAARQECLDAADEALARVRLYLRLTARLGWLTAGQYQPVATMVAEIGRLLGGWRRATTGLLHAKGQPRSRR
jgi:hypothetical protein